MALIDKKLTELTEILSVPDNAFIHVVDPNDVSQSPQGSSYKAKKSTIGGAVKAQVTVSGTVKVDSNNADPIVYLKGSVDALLSEKQDTLVNGINIASINNQSLLNGGNIEISSSGGVIDDTVIENSTNAVSGGGVYDFVQPILEKEVPLITDSFTILDSVDSKRKKLTFDNLINYVKVFFDQSLALFKTTNFLDLTSSAQTQIDSKQVKDTQIEVNGSTNVSNAWNGKTILVTASCTITIPATLLDQFMFVGRTLAGVTLTIAITAPFTFETAPTTITEKKTFSLIRRGSTNTILLDS
jgi:hypothetical protein